MTKKELIEKISLRAGMKEVLVEGFLNATTEIIGESLKAGEDVSIQGFGSFKRVFRKARAGRNPQNGQPVEIPARYVPGFKPGKNLKNLVK